MSQLSRNWLKFGSLIALAFVLGLFFAGLLEFPRTSMAQDSGPNGRGVSIVPVDAPRIPAARPLAEMSEAFSAVAEAVRPSVVFIEAERNESRRRSAGPQVPYFGPPEQQGPVPFSMSTGSGFIVSEDGFILTNHHVIDGATNVSVRLLDGRTFDAEVVGSDADTDVGVLKIDTRGLTPAALGSSADVRVGEWVLAIGNPLGDALTFSVTQGIVSAKGRGRLATGSSGSSAEILDFIQTDAAINQGNSGGPLVNVRGEVVGINSAIATLTGSYSGYAFAVPMDLARAVMHQIIERGHVERTAMGVFVEAITPEDADYLGLDAVEGVEIQSFASENSPAERAGMRAGDVVVSIDGTPIAYVAQLQQLVGFRRPGETVRVTVVRPDGTEELEVRLTGVDSGPTDVVAEREPPARLEGADNPLAMVVEPVTTALARELELPAGTRGMLVRELDRRSPARRLICPVDGCSGAPDVITHIEDREVRNPQQFDEALEKGGRNGVVTLRVVSAANGATPRITRVRLLEN